MSAGSTLTSEIAASLDEQSASVTTARQLSIADVYAVHSAFLWRSLRRLGVDESMLEDALQDVFVVVHRRLGEFEGRSSLSTWLYAIALRVARNYRRRSRSNGLSELLSESVADPSDNPSEAASHREALEILQRLLAELDDDKRDVLVMTELERMTIPEIASVTGLNLNTAYARLRAARAEFERIVQRYHRRSR